MGIKHLFGGSKSPKPSPDDVFAQYDLPPVGYIAKLEQATARLENATTSEEAIAIVRAYIQPKVEEKGMQPLVALDSLDSEVPEWRSEIQIVREAFGLNRGGKKGGWGSGAVGGLGVSAGGA
ncbi:uncharacterized protein EHS24_000503 [Apiotrichum porosum]|uniref:Uncharacterized protein n=1 Tax=Apiotrichum porosum TaxID=105984 RepID=A0A427Y9Z4_9TREE|nr:uncharacterized protein EHS24_000503 [Apiotrichum porosum]RSH87980.1 hypothetical protein EHS24_000503 [Apiotrichum porosum]